jgi:hypothetical protein
MIREIDKVCSEEGLLEIQNDDNEQQANGNSNSLTID